MTLSKFAVDSTASIAATYAALDITPQGKEWLTLIIAPLITGVLMPWLRKVLKVNREKNG